MEVNVAMRYIDLKERRFPCFNREAPFRQYLVFLHIIALGALLHVVKF